MGSLTYDGTVIQFEDRLLTHLQIVIVQKLTRGESFLMSWKDGVGVGDGRGSIWLAPSIPIYFKFVGGRVPSINQQWLIDLGKTAESSTGLIVTDEDGQLATTDANDGPFPGDIRRQRR